MKTFFFLAAGVLGSIALFAASWGHPFVLDDLLKIQQNFDLRVPFSLHNFFYPYSDIQMHMRNDPSRPLTYMFYWLCWQVGDGSPLPFHALSTILHGLNSGLVAALTLTFVGESVLIASAAGLLFLTAPILAGTVVYAFGLSDLLATFLILCGLLYFARGKLFWPPLLFYALALLAKQSAIVFPALVFFYDYFHGRRWRERSHWLKTYLPLASIGVLYLIWRFWQFGALGDLEGDQNTIPWADYFLSEGALILKYIALTFWPLKLTIDHRIYPIEGFTAWFGWFMVVGFTALAGVWRKASLPFKAAGFGWCFFLFTLLPTSSFLPTVDLFVERRAYLADVGLFLAIAVILAALLRSQKSLIGFIAILIATQSALSFARSEVYGSPERLWLEALDEDAENPRALINLGVYYSAIQEWDKSKMYLEQMLKLQPDNGSIYGKLAYIYQQKSYSGHDDAKAQAAFEQALRLSPEDAFARFNAGVFYLDHQRWAEAEQAFLKAAEISPQMTEAWLAAGKAAFVQKKMTEAKSDFQAVLRLNPDSSEAKIFLQSLP